MKADSSEVFRCERYACRLSLEACVARQDRKVKIHSSGRYRTPVGFEFCASGLCQQGNAARAKLDGLPPPAPPAAAPLRGGPCDRCGCDLLEHSLVPSPPGSTFVRGRCLTCGADCEGRAPDRAPPLNGAVTLLELRRRSGLSQQTLAQRLGVSNVEVSRRERDGQRVRIGHLRAHLRALGGRLDVVVRLENGQTLPLGGVGKD